MSAALHLILLAGGKGLRASDESGVPKQFRPTGRGLLFAVSLREFCRQSPASPWHLASVTVTAPARWHETIATELADLGPARQMALPGETRTASTWNAVRELRAAQKPASDDLVAVHDAARPFASRRLLDALALAALTHGGAVPGVAVPDTIVQAGGGPVAYLRRDLLRAVQTPQVFQWAAFAAAHQWAHEAGESFTDDGGLLAQRGQAPAVVPGEAGNWKVTTAADWQRAVDILR